MNATSWPKSSTLWLGISACEIGRSLSEVFYTALGLLARMGRVREGALMDFRVLGPVEVRDDQDRVVPLRGQLDRALLALL